MIHVTVLEEHMICVIVALVFGKVVLHDRLCFVSLYSGKCSFVPENTGTKKCVKEQTKTPHHM